MQVEGLGLESEILDQASLAHLMLLIHTFLEDRLLDGQTAFSRTEALFVKQLHLDGMDMLEDVAGESESGAALMKQLHSDYFWAQTTTYLTEDHSILVHDRVRRVATGRAAMGALASSALAARAGVDERTSRVMRNAYDCVVTGLQWADDMTDWREDLETGDENLLLLKLIEHGLDGYSHPDNALRFPNVGHALRENGVIELSAKNAKRWFEYALQRQRELGCDELADLIEKRIPAVDSICEEIENDIEIDVAAAFVTFKAIQEEPEE